MKHSLSGSRLCSTAKFPAELLRLFTTIDSVQRSFTKYLLGLYHMSYVDRLAVLRLESLELRRLKADLIFCIK